MAKQAFKPPPSKTLPLAAPVKGVDASCPFAAQPEQTCATAVNVRTFDFTTESARVGQRSGLSKWYANVVAAHPIQDLNAITVTV